MLSKCYWIVFFTVHFTAFRFGGWGPFFADMVYNVCIIALALYVVCTVDCKV